MVACMYTRRGGIDINPVRVLPGTELPTTLANQTLRTNLSFRQ